jgi:hypothetical protein
VKPARPARSFPPLRRRLFLATVVIVIASIGIAFGVGVVLTRQSVESANLDGLNRQAQLIKNNQSGNIFPFSPANLRQLNAFLRGQREQVHLFALDKPTPYLTDRLRLELLLTGHVKGTVTVGGERYLVAGVSRIDKRPA